MERNAMQSHLCEGFDPTSARTQNEANPNNEGAPYWGVLCRTCRGLVAFDGRPYVSFGPGMASLRPGAIRCSQGHNHIYFPRDFGFRGSAVPIAQTVMRDNRDVYRAINSSGARTSHEYVPKPPAPAAKAEPEGGESEGELDGGKIPPAKFGRDPRREAAHAAAKERWTNWAVRKIS